MATAYRLLLAATSAGLRPATQHPGQPARPAVQTRVRIPWASFSSFCTLPPRATPPAGGTSLEHRAEADARDRRLRLRLGPWVRSSQMAKRLGVVLGGGGVRALAHIGVLRALELARLPPDVVVGVSMGAAVATTYAVRGDGG